MNNLDNIEKEIKYYNEQGINYYNLGNYDKSAEYFKIALEKSKIFSKYESSLNAIYNLSFVYEKIGDNLKLNKDMETALRYYEESLKLISFCKNKILNKKEEINEFIKRVNVKKSSCLYF